MLQEAALAISRMVFNSISKVGRSWVTRSGAPRTGAAGNLGIGDRLGVGIGFAAGAANSLGGDAINTHKVTWGDAAWAAGGGALGGGLNAMETGMSNASQWGDATTGNGWGVGLSGMQGLLCGGMDSQAHWNC